MGDQEEEEEEEEEEAWHFLEANEGALVPFSECEVALGLLTG